MGVGGPEGEKAPLKVSKKISKGKNRKCGVFSCIKVIKISFSVIQGITCIGLGTRGGLGG